jgi:hypothetical protein
MFFTRKIEVTPTQQLASALESLTTVQENLREAVIALREQRADLDEQLRTVSAAAARGDKVFDNLSALLGE